MTVTSVVYHTAVVVTGFYIVEVKDDVLAGGPLSRKLVNRKKSLETFGARFLAVGISTRGGKKCL